MLALSQSISKSCSRITTACLLCIQTYQTTTTCLLVWLPCQLLTKSEGSHSNHCTSWECLVQPWRLFLEVLGPGFLALGSAQKHHQLPHLWVTRCLLGPEVALLMPRIFKVPTLWYWSLPLSLYPLLCQVKTKLWNQLGIGSTFHSSFYSIFYIFLFSPNKTISISSSQSLNISINSYNQIDLIGYSFVLAMEEDSMTVMSRRREIIVYLSTS